MRPLEEGSAEPLLKRYDCALLDLDGVVYVGEQAVAGAPDAVLAARAAGMRVAFVTNNASRTPDKVAAHLNEVGISAQAQDVVTSAQAAAHLVADMVPAGSSVLVIGGEGLDVALVERGLRPVRTLGDAPAAVVQGFAPDVGWRLLAEGAYAVRAGLPWVASNLDVTVPTARGLAPGNGTLVDVIAQATGRRPVAAGKPELPLHREAVQRTGATSPLVVGDRLDTDIQGANRADVASLLVLTGVTDALDLLGATPAQRPTYVAVDLPTGLGQPHPVVERVTARRWRCRGWECAVGPGGVDVRGSGEAFDGLRAAAVACWSASSLPSLRARRRAVERLGIEDH